MCGLLGEEPCQLEGWVTEVVREQDRDGMAGDLAQQPAAQVPPVASPDELGMEALDAGSWSLGGAAQRDRCRDRLALHHG